MNIEIRSKLVSFMDLSTGECLIYGNNVFIKINSFNDNEGDTFNAISLMNGETAYFADDEYVTKANRIIVE